jgi:single-strand DNA-binding protein
MNQVNVIGNIGNEPEIKSFQSGKKVARFSIAINAYTKEKDPDKKPAPTWIPCEMWDASVERMIKCREKAGLKGRKIQVTGALALNVYTATVGTEQRTVKKLYVKVHAFELLGGLKSEEEETEAGAPPEIEAGAVLDGPAAVVSMMDGEEVTQLPGGAKARKRA